MKELNLNFIGNYNPTLLYPIPSPFIFSMHHHSCVDYLFIFLHTYISIYLYIYPSVYLPTYHSIAYEHSVFHFDSPESFKTLFSPESTTLRAEQVKIADNVCISFSISTSIYIFIFFYIYFYIFTSISVSISMFNTRG